jgi:hypothetical protein
MTFYDDDPAQFVRYAIRDLVHVASLFPDPQRIMQDFLVDLVTVAVVAALSADDIERYTVAAARELRWQLLNAL